MRVTCVHQGFELYGSDRSFVETVAAIRTAYPGAALDVVLPRDGALAAALAGRVSRLDVEALWILRRRGLRRLLTHGLLRLPAAVSRARRRFRRSDLVYVNTSVVADYLLAARLFPRRALVHVHEVPEGTARAVLRALLRWSGAEIVFNSRATRTALSLPDTMRQHVIYNGLRAPADVPAAPDPAGRPLRLLMIGRINRIKGQEVLIEALRQMPADVAARFVVRIVGSAFEDEAAETRIAAMMIASPALAADVTLMPFVDDPAALYRWADVVVVPSRRPESLGRVAIEAMSYGRPVIASDIGGLPEVVQAGETGWLLPPNNAAALARALQDLLDPDLPWSRIAAAGRARFAALFDAATVDAQWRAVLEAKLGPR